jgi:hypothetical protein
MVSPTSVVNLLMVQLILHMRKATSGKLDLTGGSYITYSNVRPVMKVLGTTKIVK